MGEMSDSWIQELFTHSYNTAADRETGRITRIMDKEAGRDLLDAGAPHGFL